MKNNIVDAIVFVGASGSGKTELAEQVQKAMEQNGHHRKAKKLRTATTRVPRAGEVDGVHYDFLSVAEFERMIANNELVEYTNYAGNYYGLPSKTAEKMMAEDLVLAVMDIDGALALKRRFGERVVTVFLSVDPETIAQRMLERGDAPAKIQQRIDHAKAKAEFDNGVFCDYIVNNDGCIDEAVEAIKAIIEGKE